MRAPYTIVSPTNRRVPIVVSVPHCGIQFPNDLESYYNSSLINPPDDTDFHVQELYDFVVDLGITLVYAHYSRWVIDLNRSAINKNLYDDGRIITSLTPLTNFLGQTIYSDSAFEPTEAEIMRRKKLYYYPYYEKLGLLLDEMKKEFGQALLWDAHSIRRTVPTISDDSFPDLILGTNDGKSASAQLCQITLDSLDNFHYSLTYNHPFKGGNITRTFGKPEDNIHAIQLEMCKDLYMDQSESKYDLRKASQVKNMLQNTFEVLINELRKN